MQVERKDAAKPSGRARRFALTALGVVLVVALLGAAVYALRQRLTSTGPYLMEYEGKIIDKSVTIQETRLGSRPVRRLLIRGRQGEEFQVIVNEELYGRAQTGMWIKSRSTGAEVGWKAP